MNLRQLRYLCEVARRPDLNVSAAAAMLDMNQPGLSKQIRSLEEELGVAIFRRGKNRFLGLTSEGERIVKHAETILNEARSIREIGQERKLDRSGPLVIAVTHTQARYFLPSIMKAFSKDYPKVRITMRHADPERIASMLRTGEADLGVTTNEAPNGSSIVVLPCREFKRVVVVPHDHALVRVRRLTLKQLAGYPLVTYEPAFTAREDVLETFRKSGLEPKVVIGAIDGDVIKTCVEQGLGYAVLSEIAFDRRSDGNLTALPAGHLFPSAKTRLWLWRGRYIRRYVYDFIELCAPSWSRSAVERVQREK